MEKRTKKQINKLKSNTMGFDIGKVAEGATGGVVGAGLGLLLEGHNDRRQRRQQQALTNIQSEANRKAAEHSADLQFDMWNKTNYEAQKEHMKNAGLNPALMYGMSGGGGATTGGVMEAGVSGGSAAGSSGETLGLLMQQAQIENLKANTEKTKVEAGKIGGVDTDKTKVEIESLTQGINNQKAVEALTKVQTKIKEIESAWTDATETYKNEILKELRDQAIMASDILHNDRSISDNTRQAKINLIKTEATNAVIMGASMKMGIQLDKAKINQMTEQLAQGWQSLSLTEQQNKVQQILMTAGAKLMDKERELALTKVIIQGTGTILNGIGQMKGGKPKLGTPKSTTFENADGTKFTKEY